MSKPSWDEAPKWASYLAQDGSEGAWFWFENEPTWDQESSEWVPTEGRHDQAFAPVLPGLLEKRP